MSERQSSPEDGINIFEDPSGYFKPEPKPSFAQHTLRSGNQLNLRLVGHNPLWGHHLWNAGRTIADYLEDNTARYVSGRTILEFGAGAGLPSLVCAARDARKVVVTDYPDVDLIENLKYNIEHCTNGGQIEAAGYLWGNSVANLVDFLPSQDNEQGFQTLILADLLFNHSEHRKLVKSIGMTMQHSSSSYALVFFTPYRPWLLEKDLAFFDLAREAGFHVKQIFEKLMDKVMFEEDPGDEVLRRTVYGYELTWSSSTAESSGVPQ